MENCDVYHFCFPAQSRVENKIKNHIEKSHGQYHCLFSCCGLSTTLSSTWANPFYPRSECRAYSTCILYEIELINELCVIRISPTMLFIIFDYFNHHFSEIVLS